ncbi:hypothetical protein A7985_07445 [Pseudoalteromonas luteoviolacea]|uniref:Uncharacterized protein n=1 Tax=Pseudoalteromonas luteoviolacea TaxID=43657 RepID=A0A1C0TWQ8_9GAMM|nr:hypothetical protein [Pseudoalteromonas luteoviolacea]OCQ23765.1 hypothetical protein A7985_07445 [Pseudoalteromonas luteoviolacea]
MPKFAKFILLAIPTLGLGVLHSIWDRDSSVRFSAKGSVALIEWESRNHGIPRIEIKLKNGELKRFSSSRIILTSSSVKVGDSFEKLKGSNYCLINSEEILCVN